MTWPIYTGGLASSQVREAKQTANQNLIAIEEAKRTARQAAISAWEQLTAARALIVAAGSGRDPRVAVPAPAVTALQRVLAIAPDEPDALWYLGLAAAQRHDADAATGYWRRLLAALPPSGEDRKMVQAAVDALASGRKASP